MHKVGVGRRMVALAMFLTLALSGVGSFTEPAVVEAAPDMALGNRRYTVPANGVIEVIVRAYCLDKPRHFPGRFLQPTDHQVSADVARTFAYAVAKGHTRKDIYQTQLAIWFLRDGAWFNVPPRPRDLADEIVRKGKAYPVPEKPTDAPTLIEAVQQGKITARIDDFHATTENYEGTGTLVLTNLTDEPVTLYITVGTVFDAGKDDEQRMIAWPQGDLSGYTRAPVGSGYAVNVRSVESRRYPQVAALVSVIDNRQLPVRDLSADRFVVTENGKVIDGFKVTSVTGAASDEPVSLVVLVETGPGGMAGNAPRLAADFIEGLKERDGVTVLTFGEKVTPVVPPTVDKAGAMKTVGAVPAEPGARLFDGVTEALEAVGKLPAGRRGIVLFSTGRDTGSDPDPADVLDWAAEQGTPMYTIAVGDANRASLDPFAQATGGLAFAASSPTEAAHAFESIASYLRDAYRVEYASTGRADGARRKIEIGIKDDSSHRPGEGAFLAYRNPPQIDLLSPKENDRVTGPTRVEIGIRSLSPVTELEVVANGKPLTVLRSEPWIFEVSPEGLNRGQNSINITARDKAGNQSVKVVPLIVPADNAARETLNRPMESVARGDGFDPLPIGLSVIGLAALGGAGFAAQRYGLPELRRRIPARCSIHGTTYPQSGNCPLCVDSARKQISERLITYNRPGEAPMSSD